MNQNIKNPPRIFEFALLRLVMRRTGYSALGDFNEQYNYLFSEHGFWKANSWYLLQIGLALPQFISYKTYWSIVMFRNYLKIAVRNLLKQKVYSLINITGLTVGMAACLLIYLYVQNELSYDRFHENAENIYRIALQRGPTRSNLDFAGSPAPLADKLLAEFPEVVHAVRFDDFAFKEKALISSGDKAFYEGRFFLAENSLFDVFTFPFVKGDPATALKNPGSIVITESIAKKYFENNDPIGKIINYEGQFDFEVSGVIKDIPQNSHFRFDFVASFANVNTINGQDYLNFWGAWNFYTYIMLQEGTDIPSFENKLNASLVERIDADRRVFLQRITDIHLHSNITKEFESNGDIRNVYVFSSAAVLILLIACINFMNLYTAKSEMRAKEVGIRKVVGARRKQLVTQFLGESTLMAFIALPFTLLLLEGILPNFNNIAGTSLSVDYLNDLPLLLGFVLLACTVGLLSGSYPALFVASFRPIKTIRGKLGSRAKGLTFRNTLVVFQFAVSIAFIAGSMIMNSQMDFLMSRNLGYNRENIVNVPMYSEDSKTRFDTFRNEILTNNTVLNATATSFTPSVARWREGKWYEGQDEGEGLSFFRMSGDFNLVDFYQMELLAGRGFNKDIPTDLNNAYILNESAVRAMGWSPNQAIGKGFANRENGVIVGVVKDFNFMSLHNEVHPMAINVLPRMYEYISIRVVSDDMQETIAFLQQKWTEVNPDAPFEYYFYDDEFDKIYKSEVRSGNLFSYFTFLAIFVASLGLFGLASFTVERRTKEIGVRKVLGANFQKLSVLLTKDFLKLILVANIIAWPVTYVGINKWLQNFAFTIGTDITAFVLATIMTLFIAIFTVSFQLIKVNYLNPVQTLRRE